LLIPVLLAERGLLEQPLLYLSAYFESHKTEYYSLLLNISQKSEWITWIRFFLYGIISQSSAAAANIQELMSLKEQYAQKLNARKASRTISMIVDYLFHSPIITISGIATYLRITYHPAKNAVESLQEMGILVEHEQRQRGKTYMAHEILRILTYET
jgi:Fic family protein